MTQVQMTKKRYDLEDRTFRFAQQCRSFVAQLAYNMANKEYARQLIRSSGSVAANYIEANEALSRRDFAHRIMICRKEAKESLLWLRLIDDREVDKPALMNEATELMKIFGAIVEKVRH